MSDAIIGGACPRCGQQGIFNCCEDEKPQPSKIYDPATFTSHWGPFAAAIGDKRPPQIPMAGGIAASSPCPPFHLIPTIGLIGLAERFQKGVDRKGDKAWNATSSNQACLKDKAFAIERISHIIDHAMKLRDKLKASDVAGMAEDDDAGAIAWAGIFLYCVVDGLKKDAKHESSS